MVHIRIGEDMTSRHSSDFYIIQHMITSLDTLDSPLKVIIIIFTNQLLTIDCLNSIIAFFLGGGGVQTPLMSFTTCNPH